MTYALSTAGLARLHQFVGTRALLAFDVDGTLAPIVARPWDACIPTELQRHLAALAAVSTVAIITGRAVADAHRMLKFRPAYLIGNHGAEGLPGYEAQAAAYADECSQWLEELSGDDERWREDAGITLEAKTYSLAFHYRHAADHDEALRTLEARASRLEPAPRVIHGNCVLNIVPRDAPHKGDALRELLAHSGCERALYVGDDTTDEDVFRLDLPALLSVRVRPSKDTAADLYLAGQQDVVKLLDAIEKLIEPSASAQT